MSGQPGLGALAASGVSIWLDDLDRHRISSGGLARLVSDRHVTGVTTNPTIFDRAVSSGSQAYAEALSGLSATGADADAAVRVLTTDDVRAACDVMRPVWERTGGVDGRVSIEVDPRLARDTAGTIEQARELWSIVDRPNALIKIPATREGLPAVTAVLGEGICVNVTLIFSVERYVEVVDAWLDGLEAASARGLDLRAIHSVASFFVSRVDTAVDRFLDGLDRPDARALRGRAAIANAQIAWAAYDDMRAGARWESLRLRGAHPQRPLWASTGVKDPAYDDTTYVVDLVVDGCVNTMPEATLEAVADHGQVRGDTVSGRAGEARQVWKDLESLGLDTSGLFATLEADGVDKFVESWRALLSTIESALRPAG